MTAYGVSFWQRRNWAEPLECDVAVVGAGVAGCATAFWLTRLDPSLDVLVIERDSIASGATGRNAGFLLQGSSSAYSADVQRLGAQAASRLWKASLKNRNLIEEYFATKDVGFRATGSCTAAGSLEEAEKLAESAGLLQQEGVDAEYLDAIAVNKLLGSNGYHGGLIVGSGAVVDPVRLARAMLRASGARVFERLAVRAVSVGTGSAVELETAVSEIQAGKVVMTLNAYLPLLEPELAEFVRPVRAQMLATHPVAGQRLPMPVYSHDGFYYVRQLDDGRMLVGGARHLHRSEEIGYSLETTPQLQKDLEKYLRDYFPDRLTAEVDARWSGTMGFSPDGLPIWGVLSDLPDALWVGGFTGHGMSIAFLVGKMMAELALGRDGSELTEMFNSSRFRMA